MKADQIADKHDCYKRHEKSNRHDSERHCSVLVTDRQANICGSRVALTTENHNFSTFAISFSWVARKSPLIQSDKIKTANLQNIYWFSNTYLTLYLLFWRPKLCLTLNCFIFTEHSYYYSHSDFKGFPFLYHFSLFFCFCH